MGMDIVVRAVGIIIVLFGILLLIKPSVTKALTGFFSKGNRIYIVAVLRFALAVIFLVASRECSYPWIVFAFGIVVIDSMQALEQAIGANQIDSGIEFSDLSNAVVGVFFFDDGGHEAVVIPHNASIPGGIIQLRRHQSHPNP